MAIANSAAGTLLDGLPKDAAQADPQPDGVSVAAAPAQPAGTESGAAHVAWMVARQRGKTVDRSQGLLLLRFALTNLVAISLLAVAWALGFIEVILAADETGLCLAIGAVFLFGLGLSTLRVWQTSRELDKLRNFNPLIPSKAAEYLSLVRGREGDSRGLIASSFRLKLTQRIALVRHTGNSLVLLGLIGTVIGFVIALSGIEPDQAGDVKAIAPMVSTMIGGMSTALYTTLVGAVLNLWLMTNHQILAGGTVKLISGLIEFGETHGGS